MSPIFKKLKWIIICLFIFQVNVSADSVHYIDFKYILNQSDAGKKAQAALKNKLEKGIKSLKEKESLVQEEEKKIIKQKKVLSAEEYNLLDGVAKQRSKARSELLKNLNPILADYMKEKQIRMVVDKKNILLADENLDITNEIMSLLNKKLKSIKLN